MDGLLERQVMVVGLDNCRVLVLWVDFKMTLFIRFDCVKLGALVQTTRTS